MSLPPCGLYRTLGQIGPIPANRLVYFHNHGDPGPGLYVPKGWTANEARFDERGSLLGDEGNAMLLVPLAPQGFYRVAETFFCCEKQCQRFDADQLVQLGYDGEGNGILFVPEMHDGTMRIPDRGSRIEPSRVGNLAMIRVAQSRTDRESNRVVH
jgi:hypothetical protein